MPSETIQSNPLTSWNDQEFRYDLFLGYYQALQDTLRKKLIVIPHVKGYNALRIYEQDITIKSAQMQCSTILLFGRLRVQTRQKEEY